MTATDDDGGLLLSAIRAHPDEDTPRLVYADWLQEQGQDDRAEFIRVQVELHHEEPGYALDWAGDVRKVHDRSANPKIRRAVDLCRLAGGWLAGIHTGSVFRRGFVDAVRCDWPTWRDHGDALLAAHPVRTLTLTTEPELEAETRPTGERLYGLLINSMTGRYTLRGVLHSPTLNRLAGTDRTLARQLVELRWPGVRVAIDAPDPGGFLVPDDVAPALRRLLAESGAEAFAAGAGGTLRVGGGPPVPIAGWRLRHAPPG